MRKTKAYDRAGLERAFKDKEFEQKETLDISQLELAIKFMRQQVEAKKAEIADIERQTKEDRAKAKVLKREMMNIK